MVVKIRIIIWTIAMADWSIAVFAVSYSANSGFIVGLVCFQIKIFSEIFPPTIFWPNLFLVLFGQKNHPIHLYLSEKNGF